MISKRLISSAVYAFKPDGQYILPASQQVGRSLTDTPARKIRKFKTKGALKRSLLLSISSDPPWKANPDYARQDQDSFFGKLTIFNKTKEPIVIMSIDSDYRLIGDKEYVNTESCKPEPNLPITVEPLKSVEVSLCIEVLRSDKMADLKLKWWGRALVARDRPIRFRIRVSDMEEEEGYLVTEYVNVNHQPTKKSDDSLAFFYLDDFDRLLRFNVEVEYDTQLTVKNLGIYLSPERMHMIAYKAIKAGISEYALDVEVSSSVEQFQAQVWALIDFKCRRIYALKILMRPKDEYPQTSAVLGYVLCPDYGNNGELRSISMAQETVQFPTLEPETRMEYEQDDTFDDEVVDNPASLISAVVTNSSKIISDAVDTHASVQQGIQNIGSFDQLGIVLESKLTSIDVKLERTVTALERTANAIEGLAAMLKTLALHQSKEQ
ncbi:hypothetical protein BC833DRAFT_236070 [Globomyces pollinis-pini]|nr:hypothetical protein BC833DRAFT_236070 [Globomyces pollinis-pini]